MKSERTKNATRNIVSGVILKIYQMLVPFIMRTAMIYFMGVQYLGLNSLFISILQVLNLAELGVGGAMVYSMFQPIVDGDKKTICALMRLYRIYYRIIGLVIGGVGLILTPWIPSLIKSGFPDELNIYVLYWLNLAATVLSYWLFAYKNCLLAAHQRKDVENKVTIVVSGIQYLLQLFVLCFLKDYYVYLIVALFTQAVNNIVTAIAATRMFPAYEPKGKLPREKSMDINRRIRDLFTSKIGAVIVNSADTIVISAFLGLTMLAIYQNYFYILNAVYGIVGVVFTACMAGIGNSIITEHVEKNYNDLKKFTFIIVWIAGFCTVCLLCLYQPFMKLWVGEDLELEFAAVICFCMYYFVQEINALLNTYKDAAGIWHKDRFRTLVTAGTNLVLNLILVQFWGIYGVLISTVVATLLVGMPWLLHNLFTTLFERKKMKAYVQELLVYVGIEIVVCACTLSICSLFHLGTITTVLVRLLVCCLIPNIIFYMCYRKKKVFRESIVLADNMTKGKLRLQKRLLHKGKR